MGLADRDYMRARRRRGQLTPEPRVVVHPMQKWIMLLSAVTFLYPAYREAKRSGWLSDAGPSLPFPATGSVTVARGIERKDATSKLRVSTADANAVVQLFERASDRHVISVYVRREDHAEVPVPPGTYRMRIIEGDKWHGRGRFFGPSTTYETVVKPMTFTATTSNGFDLHRRPGGKLHTRVNLTDPPALD
ncbi:hypothetical protein [Sphingobium yanoikuyae]|uniref:hypothetical protein n=1 Tax=Sphingobium yanoikuyae TaxID=13690 RepID=UPI0028A6FDA0|nr:hypothetical protein [Sphingobium yanoikuyae]